MTGIEERDNILLDLLYGELSPEEEAEMRVLLESNEELLAQFEELQAERSTVQNYLDPAPEVPEELTKKLIALGSSQGTSRGSAKSNARPAPVGPEKKPPLWYELTYGKLKAPLSVAVVLICFSFAIIVLFGETIEDLFTEAEQEVASINLPGSASLSSTAGGGGGGGGGRSYSSPARRAPAPVVESAPAEEVAEEESDFRPPVIAERREIERVAPPPSPQEQQINEPRAERIGRARAPAPAQDSAPSPAPARAAPAPRPAQPAPVPEGSSVGAEAFGSIGRSTSGGAARAPESTIQRREIPQARSAADSLDSFNEVVSDSAIMEESQDDESAPPTLTSAEIDRILTEATQALEAGQKSRVEELLRRLEGQELSSSQQESFDELEEEL